MKKNNIKVLISIILLLIVFLPCAVYGTYMHLRNDALGGNINKEFYYDGKLHFYDGNKLLSTYTCKTEKCGYSKNDATSSYEFEAINNDASEISKINNKYAFILDGESNYLIDLNTGKIIVEYVAIKNYSKGITGNQYIVKNNKGLWGMIQITDSAKITIPFEYEYLGLLNETETDGKVSVNKRIAKKDNKWLILNSANSILLETDNEIKSVSDKFVVTSQNQVFDYSKNQILSEYALSEIQLLDNILIGLTSNNVYVIYSGNTKNIIGTIFKEADKEYEFTIEGKELLVNSGGVTIKTVAIP